MEIEGLEEEKPEWGEGKIVWGGILPVLVAVV
jgi:hypothetical protein